MDTFIDTCVTCASLTVAALPSAPKRLRRFHIVRHDTDGRGGGSFLFEALGGSPKMSEGDGSGKEVPTRPIPDPFDQVEKLA